jgi:hypothetical protein
LTAYLITLRRLRVYLVEWFQNVVYRSLMMPA